MSFIKNIDKKSRFFFQLTHIAWLYFCCTNFSASPEVPVKMPSHYNSLDKYTAKNPKGFVTGASLHASKMFWSLWCRHLPVQITGNHSFI